jgi:four helix bundle protein
MSIPLNIAEGYGKKSSSKEFKRFLSMAMGSCNEILVILDMVRDLGYIKEADHKVYTDRYEILGRRLNVMSSNWKEY